jgi:hypothetical protein
MFNTMPMASIFTSITIPMLMFAFFFAKSVAILKFFWLLHNLPFDLNLSAFTLLLQSHNYLIKFRNSFDQSTIMAFKTPNPSLEDSSLLFQSIVKSLLL